MNTKYPLISSDQLLIASVALILSSISPCRSALVSWDGGLNGTGTSWSATNNWVGDAVPASGDDVVFSNTTGGLTLPSTNSVSGARTFGLITFDNIASKLPATLTIDTGGPGTTTARTLTVNTGINLTNSTTTVFFRGSNGTLSYVMGGDNTFTVSSSANLIFGSAVVMSGNFNATKSGAGALTLSNANTFGGSGKSFTLNEGILNINNVAALGDAANTFVINGGTINNNSGAAITTANYAQTWGGDFTFTGTTNLNLGAGAVTLTGNRTVTVTARQLTVGGAISGAGQTLTKAGAGTLLLTGNGSDFESLVVSAGLLAARMTNTTLNTITVQNGASLGYGGVANTPMGSALITLQGGSTFGQQTNMGANTVAERTIANNLVLAGDVTFGGFGLNGYFGGNVDLGGGARTITIANSAWVGGVISNGSLVVQNTSAVRSLTLSNSAATYTGPTTVNGGILALTNGGALSSSSALDLAGTSADVTFNISGISGSGTTVGSLAGAANSTINLGSKALTVGGNNNSTTFAGAASGTGGGITKTGTGTMTFSGTSTYTGATTVSGGRLVMDGTNTSSTVTVQSVASLGGAGSVGDLTISGLVAPGNSVGTLSAGNTVLDQNGAFQLELWDWAGAAGTGWDLLAVTGSLTLSNTLADPFTINLVSMSTAETPGNSINWNANLNWTNNFITFDSLVGTFDSTAFSINDTAFSNAINGTFSVVTNGNALALLYTTDFVPSPGYIWNAGSGDWSLAGNWQEGETPTNGAVLVFTGAGGVATNDAVINSAASIAFSNTTGSIALAGDALALGELGIVNQTANAHTISNNLSLATNVAVNAAQGDLILAGNITNDVAGRTLTVLGASNTLITGVISGQGLLAKSGTGSLILSAANTYTGGTLVTGGTLAGDSTSLQGNITNSATLLFSQATNGAYAGAVSGEGVLIKQGAGTLILSGNNDYSGGTLVGAGTLAGDTTALQGNITNNTTLVFSQTTNGTYSGVVSGGGVLIKDGTGNVTLAGANSYSGGTLITAGTLTGSTASLQGGITNNATLVFSQTTNGTYSGVVSGGGVLVKDGAGNLTLSGANSYSGGTLVNAGTLTGSTASLQGAITNDATLVFNQSTNGTFSAVISGNGAVTKSGLGTVSLTSAQAYTGPTTINAGGTLALSGEGSLAESSGVSLVSTGVLDISGVSGDGTTIGALTGGTGTNATVALGSKTLTFGTSSSNAFSGLIIGTGGLVKTGTGVQSFTNLATFSGGLTLKDGTIRIQGGGLLVTNVTTNILSSAFGTGLLTIEGGRIQSSGDTSRSIHNSVNIAGNFSLGSASSPGAIVFSSVAAGTTTLSANAIITTDSDVNWNQAISGGFIFTKAGAATLTLAGANTYSGGTLVSSGTLAGTTASLRGNITNDATVRFNQTTTGSYDGQLSGDGALVKAGSGAVTLEGANTYTGATTVESGSLIAANNNSLGSSAVTMSDGSVLAQAGVTLANNFTIGTAAVFATNFGSTTAIAGWDVNGLASGNTTAPAPGTGVAGVNVLDATLGTGVTAGAVANALGGGGWNFTTADGAIANNSFVTFGISAADTNTVLKLATIDPFVYRASASGPTNATLQFSLDGGFSFSNLFTTNGYARDTTTGTYDVIDITAGSTVLQNVGTNGVVFRWVNFGATLSGGTWYIRNIIGDDLVVNGQVGTVSSISSASGTGTLGISEAGGSVIFSGNVTVNNMATFTAASGGQATFSGVVSGGGTALSKTDAGTVTLSGSSANTFTGLTTVTAGTLELNKTAGTDALAGDVTVSSGAILLVSASNQVNNNANVSLSGGTIRTAAGVNEVFGNLSITGSGFLDFGTTSYATANAIGFGVYTPSALLTIDNFNFGSTLTFASDLTGSIGNSSFFQFQNGGIASSSWDGSTFTITAIPEPSTYLAAAGLLGLMLWPSRKRLLKDAKSVFGLRAPMRDRLVAHNKA
jgi:fibronectin-binding autotransporter adhesin